MTGSGCAVYPTAMEGPGAVKLARAVRHGAAGCHAAEGWHVALEFHVVTVHPGAAEWAHAGGVRRQADDVA